MFRLESTAQVAVIVLSSIVVMAAAQLAEDLLAPMILAFVIGVVMSPLSNMVDRAGLPPALAALGSLVLILLVLGALAFFIEPLVTRATSAMPFVLAEVNSFIFEMRNYFRGLERATEEVTTALGANGGEQGSSSVAAEGSPVPTMEQALFMAPALAAQVMIFGGTLFFFLLTRSDVYDFIARSVGPASTRAEMSSRLLRAERRVAQYFLTIALINAGYAVIISVVFAGIGMPSPILWGVSAGLLNFVLYLGPASFLAATLLGGLVAFDGLYSFAPAAAYLFMNLIESQFVTPTLVGRRLQVNPLAIFLALVFFLWLWGAIGGIVAIPLLLWVTAITSEARSAKAKKSEDTYSEPAEAQVS